MSHLHRPPTPVAGGVPEELHGVGRPEEHTLAGELLQQAAIGRAEHVLLLGDVALHRLHLLAGGGGQLGQLDDPVAPQGLVAVLCAYVDFAGVVPAAGDHTREGGLAHALRAHQHQRVVHLAAGVEDAVRRTNHPLTRDAACVGGVLRTKDIGEHGVNTMYAIPFQGAQVLLHRVVAPVHLSAEKEGVGDDLPPLEAPVLFQLGAQASVVRVRPPVAPELVLQRLGAPRQITAYPWGIAEGVVAEAPPQVRRVLKQQQAVLAGGEHRAGLGVDGQLRLPVGILCREVRCCTARHHVAHLLDGLIRPLPLDGIQPARPLRHGAGAAQLGHRHVALALVGVVQIAELVDAHKVESVL